jgi:hypothetical protein
VIVSESKELVGIGRAAALLTFWFITLFACGVAFLQSRGMTDFRSYYVAGQLVRHQPQALYSIPTQFNGQMSIGPGGFFPWAHLPPEAALMAPFTLVSFRTSFHLWQAMSLVLLLVAVYSLRSYFSGYSAIAVVIIPAFIGFAVGQDHIINLLILVLAYLGLKDGKEFGAGFILGIGLIRYEITLPLLLFFLVARRWRVAAGSALSGSLLLIASFVIVGRDFIPRYLKMCELLSSSHDTPGAARMPSVRGLVTAFIPHSPYLPLATVLVSVTILVWGLRKWSRWDGATADLDTLFPLALILSLLIDYQGMIYNLTSLLLPALLLLKRHPKSSGFLWVCAAATLTIAFTPQGEFGLLAPLLLGMAIWTAREASSTWGSAYSRSLALTPSP